MNVTQCSIPSNSVVANFMSKANYWDSFEANRSEVQLDMREIYLGIFAHLPTWIKRLLVIRNKAVSLVGLRGPSSNELDNIECKLEYKVGDKIGLFTLYSQEENEIIAGDDDKHLNFRVSVQNIRQGNSNKVVVTTLVEVNNLFGKVYLFIIIPFHKLVVKTLISNAVVAQRI